MSTAEWHWNGSATPRPTAREIDFTAEPTSGTAPLTVTVTSDTTIPVDRRVWLFTYRGERGGIGLGGNVTAAARVETVQLPRPGVVTVRLVETVDGIDSVKEKVDYITVRAVPGHAV